ncbi:ROK family protein [Cellulomonas timonensis]|uniref:ROK family protein n=1 Tax=Cellulomonas timonensis TaxID=1689271 RepID=UPI000A3FCBA6|nr:ROK family protein [Cellulomonas timonensis]
MSTNPLDMTTAATGGGRDPGWTVGLDVGGTKVLGVLLDDSGAVRRRVRLPTTAGARGVVGTARAAVLDLPGWAGVDARVLRGVGVGVPGVVDPVGGAVEHAVNLGIAERLPLAELLGDALGGVPVLLENDLNAAVLGAAHLAPEPVRDLAFLALGTGVAAGLLLDGTLRRGAARSAGEIGHVTLVPGGRPCECGQRGCLERYASGSAIAAVWPGGGPRPAGVELFEAAAAGDPRAITLRDEVAWAVASAVRLLVLTCDVERIVIGGGVSELGAPLLDAVAGSLAREAEASPFLASMKLEDRVRLAPLGVPVGAVGAALVGRGEASWRS